MITWILDKHVDKVRGAATPFETEAKRRGHIVHALRDSLIPQTVDVSDITCATPTIVRGSHGFVNHVHRELSPKPGGFLHATNFSMASYVPILKDLCLNANYQVVTFGEFLTHRHMFTGDLFVKPLEDIKQFNGLVIKDQQDIGDAHYTKFRKWFRPADTCKIAVCAAQEVGAEYRVVVVNKQAITGSSYQIEEGLAPYSAIQFVNQITQIWNPMMVYVVDVATTAAGYKIVEYNQFGTSGLYACDQVLIVDALEQLYSV
jgi:hypothetical protein